MIIVKVMGGLGNQMFQYAFYKALLESGKEVRLDITEYKKEKFHNGFELNEIFDINYREFSKEDLKKLCRFLSNNFLSKIFCKLFYRHLFYKSEKAITYTPEVFGLEGNKYVIGYWQTEKFFYKIKEQIINDFNFKKPLTGLNVEISKSIRSTTSVSIHVRRGDYLLNKMHNVCNQDYYIRAIDIINEKINNPNFFIFSDDIVWCKNMFKGNNFNFIDWNKKTDSYIDMQLMSLCNHNIISNSSFSYWGAWLNKNKEKIVIAPYTWFRDYTYNNDIIPDSWIKIANHFD
jgi:hypothetical protein